MAATNTPSLSVPVARPSAPISYPGWNKKDVTENSVRKLMVSKFTEIVGSYDQRKRTQDLKEGGPWYANDYAATLINQKQTKRLDFFVQRNAFFHGFPPKGFDAIANPASLTKKEPFYYRIQPNCLPTDALQNVRSGQVSFIECSSAIELAIYETLREIMGDGRFNNLFSGSGQFPMTLSPHVKQTPLHSLKLISSTNADTSQMGDWAYFANVPAYYSRHPNGESKGFNAICIGANQEGEKKYIAFGTSADGLTEQEMNRLLVKEFNEEPIDPTALFDQKLGAFFANESKELAARFFDQAGIQPSDLQITLDDLEITAKDSDRELAGLTRHINYLNIVRIKECLN